MSATGGPTDVIDLAGEDLSASFSAEVLKSVWGVTIKKEPEDSASLHASAVVSTDAEALSEDAVETEVSASAVVANDPPEIVHSDVWPRLTEYEVQRYPWGTPSYSLGVGSHIRILKGDNVLCRGRIETVVTDAQDESVYDIKLDNGLEYSGVAESQDDDWLVFITLTVPTTYSLTLCHNHSQVSRFVLPN